MTSRLPVVLAALVVTLSAVAAPTAEACSTFCVNDGGTILFGKNYDWDVVDGLVMVNKRGVVKSGMTADNPAQWTSKYGSVTFNQYGREMPNGGINEAGLVIELMWLDETEYPAADSRGSVSNLQWVQYHLDVSASVEEVIAGDAEVRIAREGQARVHFLVADRTGARATVEFLEGKTVIHTGESLPVAALTNHTYDQSLAYLKRHAGFGGTTPIPGSQRSLDRYARAAAGIDAFAESTTEDAVEYAFDLLESIAQGDWTRWSIVYDLAGMRVYFRTVGNGRVRHFDVDEFDFSCESPVTILDVNADLEGDVTDRFEPYTLEANRSLIDRAFDQTDFLKDSPPLVREAMARFPLSTRCAP